MVTAQLPQTPAISPIAIRERGGSISTAEILSVLRGEITGLHIKQAFGIALAEEIAANFSHNPGLKERKDGVPGQYIGASHYRKDAATYFGDSEKARPFVRALFADLVDPVRGLFDALKGELQNQGIELRLARSEHGQANICRAFCWSGAGMYALEPHDDVAQVLCAEDNYEIAAVANNTVVALNLYLSMPEKGGELRIWSHKPTVTDRKSQDVETTGYPYSAAYLKGIPYRDLVLKAGDIALIDGGFIHGVTRESGNGRRLLLNCFFGFARPDLVLWWT
ncbi:2OG-Fe(II) oxygenase [Bradyrhizobium arachidis]|uniref:2OG-Fe(II)-dependent halogenase WelO5 family protein n=1 Tax=Bradyrhizobium arachidis TaxID=858423 RepID=UPI0021638C56|nr:2OG-Fe(II) oxygenase [Bradyrhizobium arachidis]UVO30418.1 2OG-Fe(II) oxygenase [Bradyrhizobium arachidis]